MFEKSLSDKLKRRLERYWFSKTTTETIFPIILELQKGNTGEMERRIAFLASRVCSEIRDGSILPQQGDDCFSLLNLYLDDYHPNLDLRPEVRGILFEGTILHDYGSPFGADLDMMAGLARKILDQ